VPLLPCPALGLRQVSADDSLLIQWVKEPAPFIGLPPPNMNLTGWRDPFVVERPCETNDGEWIVLMGSGVCAQWGCTVLDCSRGLDFVL
jgi:beta-fructofuranosidase